jgi:hypothetical protein
MFVRYLLFFILINPLSAIAATQTTLYTDGRMILG